MKKLLIILLFLGLLSCSKVREQNVTEALAEDTPKVILKINGKAYNLSDFQAYILGKSLELKNLRDDYIKSAFFNDYINSRLILLDAEKRKIILNSREISLYRRSLEELKIKVDAPVLKSIYENLLISKYLKEVVYKGLTVKDKEIYNYYKEHPEEFVEHEKIKLHHIVVDSEDKALQMRDKLIRAPLSEFEKMAKEYSIAPEAKKGGDMGWYAKGDLPKEMEDVVFSLPVGEISQVVKTPMGYHIFRVDKEQKKRMLSYTEAKQRIKYKLIEEKRERRLQEWLVSLKRKYKIKIYEGNLGFNYKEEKK